jgi:hypothetical protein
MLVTQIAAFGEAAHVENAPASGREEMGTASTHDVRSIPLGLLTPAMKNRFPFRTHAATARPSNPAV